MDSLRKSQGKHTIIYLTTEDPVTVNNYVTVLETGSPPYFVLPPGHDINRGVIIQLEYARLCNLYLFCMRYGDGHHALTTHHACLLLYTRSGQTGTYQIPCPEFVKTIYSETRSENMMRTFCVLCYGQHADDRSLNREHRFPRRFLEELCYYFLEMRGRQNRALEQSNTGVIRQ